MALISLNKKYIVSNAANPSYPDTAGLEMTDGNIATGDLADEKFAGWNDVNPSFTIDLGKKVSLEYVRFHYRVQTAPGISYPESLVISGSHNGTDFTTLGTFNQSGNWATTDNSNLWSNNLITTGNYKYIRFAFTRTAQFLFFSELEVYGKIIPMPNFSGGGLLDFLVLQEGRAR